MKISIVTISYNQEKYLRQCIDSVLSQNYSDIQYIIVDPGSTDGSREIIDTYGDDIIRIYEKDSGPADGLNKGFSIATGDIFCYLNSDDTFLPDTFIKITNYLKSNLLIDVICGHGYVVDSQSKFKRCVFSDRFNLKSAAYGSSLAIQPSTFFRKGIFKKTAGFNVNNRSNWDGELLIDMALANAKIKVINEYLSCYRIHDESITGTGRLAIAHNVHGNNMFEKIMERRFSKQDIWWKYLYRLKKHLINPLATMERIKKGPVFATAK